jgi:DNA-binding NarL/FixJ family response regulator
MASVAAARASLKTHVGETAAAMRCLETAADLFEKSGAPLETARARLELAALLGKSGRPEAARLQAGAALEAFDGLEARADMDKAKALLATLDEDGGVRKKEKDALTERQVEILRFVAQGMSNGEIAKKLGLSEHTVKRHVANLLLRLNLSSRTAAVAYAAREGLL